MGKTVRETLVLLGIRHINSQESWRLVTPLLCLFITGLLTPNHNNKKSGARRARQNKTPRSDAITLRGKQRITILTANTSGNVDYAQAITPNAFGDRLLNISNCFSRFRFNWLKFELRSKLPTTAAGTYVVGVLDDDNASTATSPAQVLDYRISREKHWFSDITLKWSPIDRSKWYYITGSQDGRMQVPCTVYVTSDDAVSASANVLAFDLHYSITFEGATNSLVQASVPENEYVSLPITPSGVHPPAPLKNSNMRR